MYQIANMKMTTYQYAFRDPYVHKCKEYVQFRKFGNIYFQSRRLVQF